MVSTIPYPAFKQPGVMRPKTMTRIVLLLGLGLLVFYYPLMVLFFVFSFYALLGPVSWIARMAGTLVGWTPPKHDHDNYGEHL